MSKIENRSVVMELKDVYLNYQSKKSSFEQGVHHVLNSVSFDLYDGETLGVIGKNGCGKTTILRLMAGIIAPTSGKVRTHGGKISSLLSLGLGFNAHLTGRDNALLSAMLQGSSKMESESYLEDIKEFSELGDSFEEPVKTYSSGMRARLAFTTALKTKVDILLIDEVLTVGDAHFRNKAEAAMKARIGSDQTVVLVSHADKQMRDLCDRVIWLNKGQIAAKGETSGVLEKYQNFIRLANSIDLIR